MKNVSLPKFDKLFETNINSRTRGHSLKLVKNHCQSDLRKFFFSERVINSWNKLDDKTVTAETLNCFKERLSKQRTSMMDLFLD